MGLQHCCGLTVNHSIVLTAWQLAWAVWFRREVTATRDTTGESAGDNAQRTRHYPPAFWRRDHP